MLSSSHILAESLYRISTDVDMFAFKASAGTPSGPAALGKFSQIPSSFAKLHLVLARTIYFKVYSGEHALKLVLSLLVRCK